LLETAVTELVRVFGLLRCEIEATVGDKPLSITGAPSVTSRVEPGPTIAIPLGPEGSALGTWRAARSVSQPDFAENQRGLLEAFAGQIALALQRSKYDMEMRSVRLEAEASQLRAA